MVVGATPAMQGMSAHAAGLTRCLVMLLPLVTFFLFHAASYCGYWSSARRVGIVGYGKLGQFLVHKLQTDGPANGLELAFVWNRDHSKLGSLPEHLRLRDLSSFSSASPGIYRLSSLSTSALN